MQPTAAIDKLTLRWRLGSQTLWKVRSNRKIPDVYGLHSPDALRVLIQRERGRSDRNSHGFSVVVFDIDGTSGEPEKLTSALIAALHRRCRFTDEIGWLSAGRIAVVLPETAADGAWIFADHVRYTLAKTGATPGCQVHAYPAGGRAVCPQPIGEQLHFRELLGAPSVSPFEDPDTRSDHAVGARSEGIEPLLTEELPTWKRCLDVAGALAGLTLLAPGALLLALYIKLVSKGPVFFRQERVGYMGKPFTCWKFRTMHVHNDATQHHAYLSSLIQRGDKPMTKLDVKGSDNRIIPFGKLIRQCGLDEIPQLLNVLMGDMSLVGPRPCIPYEYREFLRWHRTRVQARPGLTGLWQVSGKNRTTFAEMMRLDITYSRRMSIWYDLWIILRTFPALLQQIRDGHSKRQASPQSSPA